MGARLGYVDLSLFQVVEGLRYAFPKSMARLEGRHPKLVALRPLNTREALPPVDALLGAMRAGGLDPRLAAFAYRLAVNYARGFVLAEIVGFTLDASSAHLRAPDLGPEELPNIVAFAPYLYGFDHDAAFEFGVETIVAGLERRLAAGPHG